MSELGVMPCPPGWLVGWAVSGLLPVKYESGLPLPTIGWVFRRCFDFCRVPAVSMLCKGRLPVVARSLPSCGCAGEYGPLILTAGTLREPGPLPGRMTLLTAAPGFFTCANAPGAAAIISAKAPQKTAGPARR
jgi:hypothetical protein